MIAPIIEKRRAERGRMLERAHAFADALASKLPDIRAAVVFGSVARGDWNKWSDIDVLIVADTLPDDSRARIELSLDSAHPGVQAVLWTPAELAHRRERRDPIALEADTVGVVVRGELPPDRRR